MASEMLQRVESIVKGKDISQFIGLEENSLFEAKNATPYDLDAPTGRYELAKDITAFANMKGGYLIIGLKTKALSEANMEMVAELDLIKEGSFQAKRYGGVIKEYTYPQIDGLDIRWVENGSSGLGVGLVFIPIQKEEKKPFLIKRLVENNEEMQQIVFGIARRMGPSNDPLTVAQLHEMVKNGKSPNSERLTRIENKIDVVIERVSESVAPHTSTANLDQRINRILNE